MMSDINNQKPVKTSGFATASLVLAVLSIISCGLTSAPGLILGIISIIQIRKSKRSLDGLTQAISATVINTLMLVVFMIMIITQKSVANNHRTVACLSNMKQIGTAMRMYIAENDSCLPPSDKWVDLLQPYIKYYHILKCPSATEKGTSYAMNKSLSSINENQMADPAKIVLLFDSIPGDNPHGGPELLPSPERHTRSSRPDPLDNTLDLPKNGAKYPDVRLRVNNFCFADGHTKSLTKEKLNTLVWKPMKK